MAEFEAAAPDVIEQTIQPDPLPDKRFTFRSVAIGFIATCVLISTVLGIGLRFTDLHVVSPIFSANFVSTEQGAVAAVSIWRPDVAHVVAYDVDPPEILAKSALAINLTDGTTYYAKNPQQKLPMASLTKLMVALLAYERLGLAERLTISQHAATIGEDSMGLTAGEQYTVKELLYGLLLHSGNDAAEALGEGISGDRVTFVKLMNDRAQSLGMMSTNFTNPSGLESDGAMYSTAEDLAILAKYLIDRYPEVLKITKTIDYHLPESRFHKDTTLSSMIDLVRTYPGMLGLKTGFTDEAGRCIISVAKNGDQTIMAVVLGSTDRREDAVAMLDYAFGYHDIDPGFIPYW